MVQRMAIKLVCEGCGRQLEVDEQYAGRTVVCPVCQAEFTTPAPEAANSDPAIWWMKIPEGRIYGPVAKAELDRWVSEGRVSHDCELRREEDLSWKSADEIYAVLRPGLAGVTPRGNPFAESATLLRAPLAARDGPSSYLAPHRGGLVLALGILAFLVACPFLSFLAWTMGTNDLREMREGRMDTSGLGMTHAGMVLGMLLSVVTIIAIIGLAFYVLFSFAI